MSQLMHYSGPSNGSTLIIYQSVPPSILSLSPSLNLFSSELISLIRSVIALERAS